VLQFKFPIFSQTVFNFDWRHPVVEDDLQIVIFLFVFDFSFLD